MNAFEVLDCGGPSEVEQIPSHADVASALSLAGGDVGEGVLDGGAADGAAARPGPVCWSLRNLRCRASSAAMETVRPLPDAACVHFARSGQAPHASGSNSTVSPGSKGSTSPAGQVMVLARRSILKSPLVNRPGRCARWPQGLANTVPPAAKHVVDDGAVHVGAVDVQLDETKPLPLDVLARWARRPPPRGDWPASRRTRRSPGSRGRARCAPCSRRSASSGSCGRAASRLSSTEMRRSGATPCRMRTPPSRVSSEVLRREPARGLRCTGAAARTRRRPGAGPPSVAARRPAARRPRWPSPSASGRSSRCRARP